MEHLHILVYVLTTCRAVEGEHECESERMEAREQGNRL